MIDYVTICILTTHARARILAFVSHAGFIAGTILIDRAFGTTIWWWSIIIGETRAWGNTISILTLCVKAAGRGNARVCYDSRGVLWSYNHKIFIISDTSLEHCAWMLDITYEERDCIVWRDCQYILSDNYKSGYGYWHDNLHSCHIPQGTDPYISDWRMLYH